MVTASLARHLSWLRLVSNSAKNWTSTRPALRAQPFHVTAADQADEDEPNRSGTPETESSSSETRSSSSEGIPKLSASQKERMSKLQGRRSDANGGAAAANAELLKRTPLSAALHWHTRRATLHLLMLAQVAIRVQKSVRTLWRCTCCLVTCQQPPVCARQPVLSSTLPMTDKQFAHCMQGKRAWLKLLRALTVPRLDAKARSRCHGSNSTAIQQLVNTTRTTLCWEALASARRSARLICACHCRSCRSSAATCCRVPWRSYTSCSPVTAHRYHSDCTVHVLDFRCVRVCRGQQAQPAGGEQASTLLSRLAERRPPALNARKQYAPVQRDGPTTYTPEELNPFARERQIAAHRAAPWLARNAAPKPLPRFSDAQVRAVFALCV